MFAYLRDVSASYTLYKDVNSVSKINQRLLRSYTSDNLIYVTWVIWRRRSYAVPLLSLPIVDVLTFLIAMQSSAI